MNKKLVISVFSLILIFMMWLSAPAPAYADLLEILPTDHDFEEVEVGTTATTIISMMNINGSPVTVLSIMFLAGSNGDFSLVSAPSIPFNVDPGQTVEVAVVFMPSAEGPVSAVLEVGSTDWLYPFQFVSFSGVGVGIQPSPVTIQAILAFFDASVIAGRLEGKGNGKSALGRLFIMRNMIKRAGKLIERGRIRAACRMLYGAYRRCDGESRPPDFVRGEAVPELNTMILQLMADMGCI